MKLLGSLKFRLPQMLNGIVGMNYRNRHLVEALNPRALMSIANDKLATKTVLEAEGIATPKLICSITRSCDIDAACQRLEAYSGAFVVKPSRSSQGRGVSLFRSINDRHATYRDGRQISRDDFHFFLQQILQGEYSFGRPQDGVLVEEMIQTDTNWILPGIPGAPDLRIVLLEGQPILAMARLPSSASEGRANLHCGAVGVGINLDTGITQGGVCYDRPTETHPDNGAALAGLPVNDFETCLQLAIKSYQAVPLGLLGVDLMRDINQGPVIIELNARPGLAVQIANREGLLSSMHA